MFKRLSCLECSFTFFIRNWTRGEPQLCFNHVFGQIKNNPITDSKASPTAAVSAGLSLIRRSFLNQTKLGIRAIL